MTKTLFVDHLQQETAKLAVLSNSKPELSIEDQVRIDMLLYRVGETIRDLLHGHALYDPWESPDALPMAADEARKYANELSHCVYDTLLDVRYALCWNSMPPGSFAPTDEERDAIMAGLAKRQARLDAAPAEMVSEKNAHDATGTIPEAA